MRLYEPMKETNMTRAEVVAECKRLKTAINKTKSDKLRRDYGKRLRKLQAVLLST